MGRKRNETGYIKYVTQEEIKILDKHFYSKVSNKQIAITYFFMRNFGFRISDALRVNIKNFHDDKITIIMQKTGKSLTLQIPENKLKFIKGYIMIFYEQILEHNGYLAFSNSSINHISEVTIRDKFVRLRRIYQGFDHVYYKKTNGQELYRISPHTLRHYVLTTIVEKTGNIKFAQAVAGHKKTSTTWAYIRNATLDEVENALAVV